MTCDVIMSCDPQWSRRRWRRRRPTKVVEPPNSRWPNLVWRRWSSQRYVCDRSLTVSDHIWRHLTVTCMCLFPSKRSTSDRLLLYCWEIILSDLLIVTLKIILSIFVWVCRWYFNFSMFKSVLPNVWNLYWLSAFLWRHILRYFIIILIWECDIITSTVIVIC